MRAHAGAQALYVGDDPHCVAVENGSYFGQVHPMRGAVQHIFDVEAEERGEMVVRFALPYADVVDLPPDELRSLLARGDTVEFSHSLEAQIGGQLRAGFVMTDMFEDRDLGLPDAGRSRYFPVCMATRSVKQAL